MSGCQSWSGTGGSVRDVVSSWALPRSTTLSRWKRAALPGSYPTSRPFAVNVTESRLRTIWVLMMPNGNGGAIISGDDKMDSLLPCFLTNLQMYRCTCEQTYMEGQ